METEKTGRERKVSEVSRDQRDVRQKGDGAPPGDGLTLGMKIQDLSAFYGSFKALTDVSIDVQANKVTALIGPSGCGKSTMLRTINRLLEPTAGNIFLDGAPIEEIDPLELRRRIGMVFQLPALFGDTVEDSVLYGVRLAGKVDLWHQVLPLEAVAVIAMMVPAVFVAAVIVPAMRVALELIRCARRRHPSAQCRARFACTRTRTRGARARHRTAERREPAARGPACARARAAACRRPASAPRSRTARRASGSRG